MRYLPSLAKLRKSFQLRSREFLRENTLHGFNYFVDSSRRMWERILWFICTFASLAAAIASITIILIKFTTAPMLTVVHIPTTIYTIQFPVILACPSSEYLNLRNYTEDEVKTLIQLYDWNWKEVKIPKSLKVTPNLWHLFETSMPACKDMIINCEYMDEPIDCSEMFTSKSTQQGKCCATTSNKIVIDDKFPSVKFAPIFSKRINLYLQSDWFLPRGAPINYRLINNISLAISMQITITQEKARLFAPSTRGCIMPDEGTSHSECQMACQKKVFTEEFGCIPWWIKGDRALACRLNEYNQIINRNTSFEKCYDNCPLQCDTTWYNIDEVRANEKITSITMKQWPLVKYKRKVIFGLLELLVSFGGIMGLFLGYSVLTTVELIYYFTLRPYCGAVISNQQHNIVRIGVSAKPRKRKPLEGGYTYRYFYMQ